MSGRTILVVEDNPLTRKMIRVALESESYRVVEAPDGRTALAHFEEDLPDLVIQDLLLPDMDGIELTRRLRQLPGAVDVPILALTGFVNATTNARIANAGFTACLEKPIDPERLFVAIRAHLPLRTQPANIGRGRRVLLVDDDPVLLKLARLHFTELCFEVAVAANGKEALDLARGSRPDAIVSDVLMPLMDGFQLCLAARRDPALREIPVVLISAQYREAPDRALAAKVGANALLARTPDFEDLARQVADALNRRSPPVDADAERSSAAQDEHVDALVRQLDRQLSLNAELAQRCSLQTAQLSLLGGIAAALARNAEIDVALREALALCLDAGGISKGVLYLVDPHGKLQVKAAIGYLASAETEIAAFFGETALLDGVLSSKLTLTIPDGKLDGVSESFIERAGVASAHVVPLVHGDESIGALMLGSNITNLREPERIAFARAIAGQITKSILLARSFDKLAASEARYRLLMDEASCAVFTLDAKGTICDANRRAEQLLGVDRHKAAGLSWLEFLKPADRQYAATRLRKTMTEGASHDAALATEVLVQRTDGATLTVEFSSASVAANGEQMVIVVANDVTERNRLRQQAVLTDKLAMAGTLAAGVAHEINNPLAYVLLNLVQLKEHGEGLAAFARRLRELETAPDPGQQAAGIQTLASDPDLVRYLVEGSDLLRQSIQGSERIKEIVRGMKGFARADDGEVGQVDVNQLLQSTIRMALHQIKYRARLETNFEPDLPSLVASAGKLNQLFLNLIVNAAQAIEQGNLDANVVGIRTGREGSRIRIDISDTGKGISRDVLPHIFDPFFTTKPVGVGTGLGLSICHEIVRNHGGEIRVASEVGRGSTFTVSLPLQTDRQLTVVEPQAFATHWARSKILVVDDERYLLRALRIMLARHHDVTLAEGGRLGLDLLAETEYDVVVTDLSMPDVSGMDLHRFLAEKHPGRQDRMVFITGGAFTTQARAFLAVNSNPCLEKPFTAVDLLRAVSNVRDGKTSTANVRSLVPPEAEAAP